MGQTDDPNFAKRMQIQYDRSDEKKRVLFALKNLIGNRHFGSVLDVGPGPGEITAALAPVCESLTLVEIKEDYQGLLAQKYPQAKIIIDSIEKVKFGAEFDAVLFSQAFYYWPEDQWLALTRRLLSFVRPGGSLFVVMNTDVGDWWKLLDHFWTKFPDSKTFAYQPWSKFRTALATVAELTAVALSYETRFPVTEVNEVLGVSQLAFANRSALAKYTGAIEEFARGLRREGDQIVMEMGCEVLELKHK